MPEEKSNVNLNINDGESFFANEVSVNFNPTHFFLDFKCVTPRIDPRNQSGATFALKHNVVILDPHALKEMTNMMSEIIQRYEKEFGKIVTPKGAKAAEKKKKTKKKTAAKSDSPGYFG